MLECAAFFCQIITPWVCIGMREKKTIILLVLSSSIGSSRVHLVRHKNNHKQVEPFNTHASFAHTKFLIFHYINVRHFYYKNNSMWIHMQKGYSLRGTEGSRSSTAAPPRSGCSHKQLPRIPCVNRQAFSS
jgi:hypothetical protein